MGHVFTGYRGKNIDFDTSSRTFSLYKDGMQCFLKNGQIIHISVGAQEVKVNDFLQITNKIENLDSGIKMTLIFSNGPALMKEFQMEFIIQGSGIDLRISTIKPAEISLAGELFWGLDMEGSTFPVRTGMVDNTLRVACGPAATKVDNALFDRLTDSVLEISCTGNKRLRFNWSQKNYQLSLLSYKGAKSSCFSFTIKENYYSSRFGVTYSPINKNTKFRLPPVGWMTWYSVQFDACEEKVLENAKWLAKNLRAYGANSIWVDWEWYHSNLKGIGKEGVDTFNPDKDRYPNGMRYLSDKIKKLKLIPAIWIGATNDTNLNRLMYENPGWVLAHDPKWCGQWWIDPSHPDVIDKYVPAVFEQLLEWGYEAVKWDCIPISLEILDRYHQKLITPDMDSEQLLRNMIKAARKITGYDYYMMSCSGQSARDVLFAADLFDGARIGGDIFTWEEFVMEGIRKFFQYYVYHNVLFYADMDNVVLRQEYNSFEQARSRVSFVSISGLPFTIGDELTKLEKERVELIKRAIPVLDIHPVDISNCKKVNDIILVNLVIARQFEAWNIIDILNTTGKERQFTFALGEDIHLDTLEGQEYLVYDFWGKRFLGVYTQDITIDLLPYQSVVLSIRLCQDCPQILSTSRHVTQGGFDLLNVTWNTDKLELSGKSLVVKEDPYDIILYLPERYSPANVYVQGSASAKITGLSVCVWQIEFNNHATCEIDWVVKF